MRVKVKNIFWLLICASIFSAVKMGLAADANYDQIYYRQCATCHGNQGDGRGRAGASLVPRPTDFTSASAMEKLHEAKIIKAIRMGVPNTSMVGYAARFDEATIKGLAEYIQSKFMGRVFESQSIALAEKAGAQIYRDNCSACHGDNGNTAVWARNGLNPAPRNFTAPDARKELTRERMINSVTHGRPGTAMMSFAKRLDITQIESVVDYIRETFMFPATKMVSSNEAMKSTKAYTSEFHNHVDMQSPFPKGLTGDAAAGKEFYQQNCYACHGRTGEGDGPRAFFNVPRPRNFTSAESRQELNRPRLYRSISHGKPGTVMPAWQQVLSEQQIANVAEYVFETFIQVKKKP